MNILHSPLLRIITENKQQWLGLSMMVCITLLNTIVKVISAYLWGKSVDTAVSGNFSLSLYLLIIMIVCQPLGAALTVLQHKTTATTVESIFKSIRLRAFSAIAKGEIISVEQTMRSGDTASRLNSDLERLAELFSDRFVWLHRILLQGLVSITACFFISWQLSLAYYTLLPISLWLMNRISIPLQKQQHTASESTGKAMNITTDMVSNIMVIKSFNVYDMIYSKFSEAIDTSYNETVKSAGVASKMSILRLSISVLQIIVLFGASFYLVLHGIISSGAIITFVFLSNYVCEGMELADYSIRTIRNASVLARRVYQIIDLPQEMSGTIQIGNNDIPIEVKNLSFGYHPEIYCLQNISFNKIRKGMKIGIVGPSGSGKSTLLKLICRFYQCTDDVLYLFGVSAQKWDVEVLRKKISLVSQDGYLFDGTIFDNIAYGKEHCTEDEVVRVVKNTMLWDFIGTLEKGLYSQVGESGSLLSGGQKQRICIARAMIKNAELIVLDEITSSLDVQTESEILESLDILLKDKTTIIVSHRMVAVRHVDYLYCLENGRIKEQGTPNELIDLKGYYYIMSKKQGLFNE